MVTHPVKCRIAVDARRPVVLLVFLSIFGHCYAQVTWDVKAGLNYSNVAVKDGDGTRPNTSPVPGILLGIGLGIPLWDQFSIQPSLVYAKRGFKAPESSPIGWGKGFDARVSYLEFPVSLRYGPKIGPGRLLVAAGPYLGYGTGGTWHTDEAATIGDIMIGNKGDMKFQDDASYGDYGTYVYGKPWDYGIHVSVGYSLVDRYTLSFGLQRGVADLESRWADYQPDRSLRNRAMGVAIGYSF